MVYKIKLDINIANKKVAKFFSCRIFPITARATLHKFAITSIINRAGYKGRNKFLTPERASYLQV